MRARVTSTYSAVDARHDARHEPALALRDGALALPDSVDRVDPPRGEDDEQLLPLQRLACQA